MKESNARIDLKEAPVSSIASPARCWSLTGLVEIHPTLAFFLLAILSNAAGSAFSILYNESLIVGHYLDPVQQGAFWRTVQVYNLVGYPLCLVVLFRLLRPLARCRHALAADQVVPAHVLVRCQRLLVNLPFYQVCLNFAAWIPGAVVFPLGIGLLGNWTNIGPIWGQFAVSFLMSATITTVQTYFILEAFAFRFLYPTFFRHDRPADLPGVFRISFRQRMMLYWAAVALVPLVALLIVVLNCTPGHAAWLEDLCRLALGVTVVSVVCSALIGWVDGRTLLSWLAAHTEATEQITSGNYRHRILEKRPAEFGQLTDRFNDMAAQLERGQLLRENFGQLVGPEVRDDILERYPGLGGEVVEITVMFVDIRGFTRRSAGQSPEQIVDLLNRFLTLCVAAIHERGGLVNKFLGDGLMALFGVPRTCPDHADRGVLAALDLLGRLEGLNQQLRQQGVPPLVVGIGIHSGPALVGCIGATLGSCGGSGPRMRKEFTAIGETVNLAQRIEQLTKCCRGPILISAATRACLKTQVPLVCLGPQEVYGFPAGVVTYRIETEIVDPVLPLLRRSAIPQA